MIPRALADLVVALHLGFIAFVVMGGFLALRWPRLVWLHLPSALWAAALEFAGWPCPLTPLERWLRETGGAVGYPESFVEHYLVPVVYPVALDRPLQVLLGLGVVLVNAVAYGLLWRRRR